MPSENGSHPKQDARLGEFIHRGVSVAPDDTITITETEDYYELIVSHANQNHTTGGAECYRLDKKTKQMQMIWHKHPREIPLPELET